MTDDEQQAEALDSIVQRKRDFQLTFGSPAGQRVLIELASFCRAAETCVVAPHRNAPIDLNRTLVLEGRREVFLRIQEILSLTPEQLFLLRMGQPFKTGDDDE